MLPYYRHAGIGVIPWSPLARGLLTRPRPAAGVVQSDDTARSKSDTYSPTLYDTDSDWNVVDAVERVAKARGVTMAEVALAWVLGRPGVAAPIVGAAKLEHLDAAVRALDLELSEDEVSALEQPYRPHPVKGHTF
jgi:aryl-alcohol dehydrogenase-like predicted oxidoreductase